MKTGKFLCAALSAAIGLNVFAVPYGFSVNGEDLSVGSGKGWSFYDEPGGAGMLQLRSDDPTDVDTFELSGVMTNVYIDIYGPSTTVRLKDTRFVADSSSITLRWLNGLVYCREGQKLVLELEGENSLTVEGTQFYGAGIYIGKDSELTIREKEGVAGSLTVSGGRQGAAIGSYYQTSGGSGKITIESGTITAFGGDHAPAIGGTARSSAYYDRIEIKGGFVSAVAGARCAAIGAGESCRSKDKIVISGGTVVTAPSDSKTPDIGAPLSKVGTYPVEVTGGNLVIKNKIVDSPINAAGDRVYRVRVTGLSEEAVRIEGLDGYGLTNVRAVEGELALYLPNGDYAFTVNELEYVVTVEGADAEAKLKTQDPPVIARVNAAGETNLYTSASAALSELNENDTLVLLTNVVANLSHAGSLNWTLDGSGWELTLSERLTLENKAVLHAKNVTFTPEAEGFAFARLTGDAALTLKDITVRGFNTPKAPLIGVEESALRIDATRFEANRAVSLFCGAADMNNPTRVSLVSGELKDNEFTELVDLTAGICAVGNDFLVEPVRLRVPTAALAPLSAQGDTELYLELDNAADFVGQVVVTNAFGYSRDAAKVRICAPGYAAFEENGNVLVEEAWARPLVRIEGTDAFVPFVTFGEALGESPESVTVGVLAYTNEVSGVSVDRVNGDAVIPAGREVTLTTAWRSSPDGTNTVWSTVGETPATLVGALTIAGTNILGVVRIEGAITIQPTGLLKLAADFPRAAGEKLYLTLSDPEAMRGKSFVSAAGLTSEQLKSFCRVTNPGWTFEVTEAGLIVAEVADEVASV